MAVGKRIKRARVAKGFSQRQLAEPRYTASYLCIIEQGKRTPSAAALGYFAERLGVAEQELLTGRPADLSERLDAQIHEARLQISNGAIEPAVESLDRARRDAHRHGLTRHEAKAIEYIGRAHEHRGELEEAIARYDDAIGILASEPANARASLLAAKARCLNLRGDKHLSIHILESAIGDLARQGLLDPQALVALHSAAVLPCFEAGLRDQARLHADEALRLSPVVDDPALVAGMHVQVARLLLDEGHVADAQASLQRAEEGFRQLDLRSEMAMARLARGYVHSREGETTEARELLAAALEGFEATGRPIDIARALNELARLDRVGGDVETGVTRLDRSIALLDETDVTELALAHRERGLCYAELDPTVAEKEMRVAIDLFELAEDRIEAALTYKHLGDLAERRTAGAGCDLYREGLAALS